MVDVESRRVGKMVWEVTLALAAVLLSIELPAASLRPPNSISLFRVDKDHLGLFHYLVV